MNCATGSLSGFDILTYSFHYSHFVFFTLTLQLSV
uniref:Uncharacterized protein n=1 Tax=Rhizophora mucronata TaxID=61149 RepID=A0A2P2NQ78_RHIMU